MSRRTILRPAASLRFMIVPGSLAANDAQYHVRIGETVTWRLLDDLVCPQEQRRRDRQAQRLGGLEVDHQLELRRLLDGQVTGPGALEDLVHVGRQRESLRGEGLSATLGP